MSTDVPVLPSWLEQLSFMLVAVAAVSGAATTDGHVVGDGVDLYGTVWFFWWVADCVEHLRDPSFTDLMFHPLGKDIFAHTGNNFVDALLAVPFVNALGFPRYQPVFVAFVLWGNAVAFRPLARRVLGSGVGPWVATVLWQTAPFTLFELMTGRVTQAFLWFLPPAVLWFMRIGEAPTASDGWRRTWQHARPVFLSGLFTALQAATYWFSGYFLAVAFAWLAAVALARPPAPRWRLVLGWLGAGFSCGVFVLPAAIGMVDAAGAGSVPGLGGGGGLLAKPVSVGNNVAATLHGYWLMETRGQPMFSTGVWGAGLVATAMLGRDRLRWLGLCVVALFLALGPVLPVGDASDGPVWSWPYLMAYNGLPFLDRLWFPYRLVVIAFLAAALGIGGVVARLDRIRARRFPVVPAACLPLLLLATHLAEQHRHLAFPLLHRELTAPSVYAVMGEAQGGLIELPIGLARTSIAWQVVHGQPTFGGMAENAPVFWPAGFKRRLRNTLVRRFRQATREPSAVRTHKERDRIRLEAEGFRWVVLDRQLVDGDIHRWPWSRSATPEEVEQAPFLAQARVTEALGSPVMVEGPLVVWDLQGTFEPPPGLRPTDSNLSTRNWDREDIPEYEQHLREIGRLPGP
ncbi:MAG: hypothetical protein VX265_09255 [Myxococcota bacterium]|nr:hypothetical protein [Myxococcota bacterium]MEC8424054.1 hypothetical protein [Myxococcota bacterium]